MRDGKNRGIYKVMATIITWTLLFSMISMAAPVRVSAETLERVTVQLNVKADNALVKLENGQGRSYTQRTTGGKAVFTEALDDTDIYRLTVTEVLGYQDYQKDHISIIDETITVELSPLEKITVSGRVMDESSQPLEGVIIQTSGYAQEQTATAPDGTYTLTLYRTRQYTVTASKTGYHTATLLWDGVTSDMGTEVLETAMASPSSGGATEKDPSADSSPEDASSQSSSHDTNVSGERTEGIKRATMGALSGEVSITNLNVTDGWTNDSQIVTYDISPAGARVYCATQDGFNDEDELIDAISDTVQVAGASSVTVSKNGLYYIYAVSDDDFQFEPITVKKIDKTAPQIGTPVCDIGISATVTFTVNNIMGAEANGDPGNVSSPIEVYYTLSKGAATKTAISGTNGTYSFSTTRLSTLFYIYAVDAAGNQSMVEFRTDGPDSPTVSASVPAGAGSWANKKTVEVAVTSNSSGSIEVRYQLDDGNGFDWASAQPANGTGGSYSFEAVKSGTYIVHALVDGIHHGQDEVVVSRVDSKSPEITVTKTPDRQWHYGAVTLTVTVTEENDPDNQSPISKVFYNDTTASDPTPLGEAIKQSDGTYTISIPAVACDKTYYVWATDEAGNNSPKSDMSVRIDTAAPFIQSIHYSEETADNWIKTVMKALSFGYFFRDRIVVYLTAYDNQSIYAGGVETYQYQLVEAGGSPLDNGWVTTAGNVLGDGVTMSLSIYPSESFQGQVYVRVIDRAGNVSEAKTQSDADVTMDNVASTEPLLVNANGYVEGNWTNEDVVLTVSGAESLSGVDYYEYRIDYTDENKTDTDWTTMPETDGSLPHVDINVGTIMNQLTVCTDTNATYYFRSMSNTQIPSSSENYIRILVQKTPPANGTVTKATPSGDNSWYRIDYDEPNLTVHEPTPDPNAAPIQTFYQITNTTTGATGEEVCLTTTGTQPTVNADGVYHLTVWTVDLAGNRCEVDWVETVKIDITPPTALNIDVDGESVVAVNQDSVAFQYFYSDTITVKLSANCDISGLSRLEYQKVSAFQDYNEKGVWTTYTDSKGIVVHPNEKFIVFFRAVDKAGLTTIIHSDGIIVDNKEPVGDKNSPELRIEPVKANQKGFYNSDVAVTVSVSDLKYGASGPDEKNGIRSGLKSITYRIITDGVETKAPTVLYPSKAYPYTRDDDGFVSSWSGGIVIDSSANNSNNVVVEVTATDNAGNTRITKTSAGTLKIDTTPPEIEVSYDNNGQDRSFPGYFNRTRTARIVVTERNFDPSKVIVTITNTDGSVPQISGWTSRPGTGNLDDTTHTATITYTQDGDYTFAISYTDQADNPSSGATFAAGTVAPTAFTIDRTVPTIQVRYDNNAAANGKYFSAPRTATITIHEHNFNASRVRISATSTSGYTPRASWRSRGDTHTATLSYTADGDYTFDIAFADKAGNAAGGANYGSSAAPRDFTVDQTIEKPILLINDADGNGKAYNGEVVVTATFEDENFDSYELTLLRTRMDEINVDVTDQFLGAKKTGTTAGIITMDRFTKVQDNDGIYTLTARSVDMAGNEETETIIFSVNRFGSVYVFGDYLVSLCGGYVQKVSEDLVITEYNPVQLVRDSLEFEVSCDGTLRSEMEYTTNPVINEQARVGSSGWYQYEYRLSPDNFASDGVYRVTVSSKDIAGNTPETKNYVDKDILFYVDTVAPELESLAGLEKNSVNAESLKVDFSVFDAIALEKVDVYIKGEKAETYSEFEDLVRFSGSFQIGEGIQQRVRLVIQDKAGNITDTDTEGYSVPFRFEREVTISTNFFVRYYANTWLFYGTIGGILLVVACLILLLILRRRKKDENEEA